MENYYPFEFARQASADLLRRREWAENDRTELLAVNARAEQLAAAYGPLRDLGAVSAKLIAMEEDRLLQRIEAVIS
jgi:hypothetical protein